MKKIEHLTKKQILSYITGSLRKKELKKTRQHLLKCAVCMASIPDPSPEQFLNVLFTENDVNEQRVEKKSESEKTFFRGFPFISVLSRQPLSIAWGSGALVLIISFSFLIWLSAASQDQPEKEVAAIVEKTEAKFDFKKNDQRNQLIPLPDDSDEKPKSSETVPQTPVSNNRAQKSSLKSRNKSKTIRKNIRRVKKKRDLRQDTSNKLATTRGGNDSRAKCDETGLGVNLGANDGKVVLRWKQFPDAAKYNLYISDDEEILIDEYETQDNTSYVLNKPLDPAKTYSWKILVTLENGETVIGASQKFSVKDFKMNEEILKSKGKSDVRCSEKARTEK